MRAFRLPDLGEGLREAEVVAWHVAAGDRVAAGAPLVTVETDKALVDVTAPWSGRVTRLAAAPGDLVAVGAVLVEFDDAQGDAGAVVGELPAAPPPAQVAPTVGARPATPPAAPPGPAAGEPPAVAPRATPRVRALAARRGVDLARVTASGPEGTVTEADVARAAAAPSDWQPVRGVRLAMARNMARAGAEVVPATVVDEADVERWSADADVTVRLVRAIAAGCAAAPAVNAWLDARRLARRVHARVDLGLAMQSDDGLFVPVLRDAGRRDAADVRRTLDGLAAAVRARTIAADDLRGATITLSNFGALGGRFAALVVVPPQVAILGAGRIAPRVVAAAGGPVVRRMLPLSLTFDHRAVTGAEAAHFLAAVVADLALEA